MHIPYGEGERHAARLARGLAKMPPDFLAKLCWWCDGTTTRKFAHCDVCGKGGYGTALGLLIGNEPAGQSVVNQVLVAAGGDQGPCLFPECRGQCGRNEPCGATC